MALQIRRRVGGAAAPPATLLAGQLAYNKPGTGSSSLFCGDGTSVDLLVSDARQVELAGAQTITGAKTIAVGNLHITGGSNGQTISTDGSGNLDWVSAPPAEVITDGEAIDGNGLLATPITLVVATTGQVTAGTDDVFPITSLKLREQMGAAASAINLGTTAATVVPAIKELADKLTALGKPLTFIGTYDANADEVSPGANSPMPASDNLPAADPANAGWVVIVTVGIAEGHGNAPHVGPISPGDWLVSTGTDWILVDLNLETVVAANVAVTTISGLTATNVQAALAEIVADFLKTVAVDSDTLEGDGTSGSPLNVIGLDDGVY